MDENRRTFEFAARFACEKGIVRYTRFLDPVQEAEARQIACDCGAVFASWGGYEQAERKIGCFLPWGEEALRVNFPLVTLHSRYSSKFCSLSHRDLLGSFMALGLTRDSIGDIIIVDSDIYLFVVAQTADFIAQSMNSAGKVPLRFEPIDGEIQIPEPKGICFHDTLSSMRLDAVIASAYRLSRSEASELIRAGLVKLNHIPCERVDAAVAEGAVLSVRGRGRIQLRKIEGLTRKQRIGVTFFRYE